MIASADFEVFDKWLWSQISSHKGVPDAVLKATVLAAGGRISFTPQHVIDILEGNVRLRGHKTPTGCDLIAVAQPRCEKCGRWERE